MDFFAPEFQPQACYLVVPFAERGRVLADHEQQGSFLVAATPALALGAQLAWPVAVFQVAAQAPLTPVNKQLRTSGITVLSEYDPSVVFGPRGVDILAAVQAALLLPPPTWQWLDAAAVAGSPEAMNASLILGDLAQQEPQWEEVTTLTGYASSYQLLRQLLRQLTHQLREAHQGLGPIVVAWFLQAALVAILCEQTHDFADRSNLSAPWLALKTGQPLQLSVE